MHSRRLLVPTLALAVCAVGAEEATTVPAPVPVQDASGPPTTLPVSATRLNSAPEDQPYAFYRHDRRELDHQTGRTAVEALNNTPGVFVQKTAGNQSSPYIRGLTGEQSLLLLDGVRLNNAMFRPGANQYSALIPDSSIGSMDVILGSANSVTGSDGLTGAIDFRLAEAGRGVDGVISPWVSGHAGYADGYRVAGGIDGRISDFVYSLDGGYAYYHDLEGGKDAGDHLYGDAAGDDTIPNSGFHEYHFGGRVAYVGIDNNRFELSAGMTEQWDAPRADGYYENSGVQSSDPTPIPTRISRYYDPQVFTYVHARHVYGGDGVIPRIQTTLYWHQQHEEQGREDVTVSGTNTANRYRFRGYEDTVDTLGLDLQLTSLIERHELTYGGTVYQDRTNNEFLGRTTPGGFANGTPGALDPANATVITNGTTNPGQTTVPDDSTYMGVGIFLQDFWRITDQWDVLAGIRYSQYSWNADVTADRAGFAPATGGIGNATLDETVDAFTGSLRVGYSPVEPVYTFAGISQGFRAPNISNLAGIQDRGSSTSGGQGPQVNGNPDLEPEKSLTYELGGRLTQERDSIALTGFYTTIEDLIQVEYTDSAAPFGEITNADRARIVNTEEARLWGAEFSFDYGLPVGAWLPAGARLALYNVTNWVNGEVDAFNPNTLRVEEFNISKANRLFGQAGVRLDLASGWWGLVRTRWSDVYDDPAPGDASDTRHTTFAAVGEDPGSMPGYAVLDAKVGWVMPGGKYWVDLALENLLNHSYREPGSGIDGSGINAILSAGARF